MPSTILMMNSKFNQKNIDKTNNYNKSIITKDRKSVKTNNNKNQLNN